MREKKVFSSLGSTNHSEKERQSYDFYSTPRIATEELLKRVTFEGNILEPACGSGAMSKVLKEKLSNQIISKDIVYRGYSETDEIIDFLDEKGTYDNVITNPPFILAKEFAEKALEVVRNKVALIVKIQFLEGQKRLEFFQKYPPKEVYVFSYRLPYMRGDVVQKEASAMCLCWFIWEKGYTGDPVIKWI